MSTGSDLWQKAKTLIPGGSMLLSKRAEMALPAGWPAYFSRTQGCTVWDLDDIPFLDVGLMGVGTNILGYSHPKVDEAVMRTVRQGNLSTLNAPEEVYLAEALIELHPWAGMARFTRSGGEACAVAVRIARAASGKDKVAFCGYHGWHDWYLSANLGEDDSLDGHLLPGLEPNGVPRALRGSSIPFRFNDIEGLTSIMQDDEVGVIFMEVQRSDPPAPGFLEGVRALASKHNAVLVFDECTSGFRRTLGGLHLHYGVEPDIATFGKTLGNGYAINAILGRTEVMQAAQTTFISSTFWTERIGPTAALATLSVMEELDAPARVHAIGEVVQARWREAASATGLEISTGGLPALANYSVIGRDPLIVKTYMTKRLLDQGFLGGMSVYASIAHTDEILDQYFAAVEIVMGEIASSDDGALRAMLPDGVAHGGFARLT
jgi:glutamate-1-semialdehyde 2,1-aminomutase